LLPKPQNPNYTVKKLFNIIFILMFDSLIIVITVEEIALFGLSYWFSLSGWCIINCFNSSWTLECKIIFIIV